jgi:putative ABC transport system permease protein
MQVRLPRARYDAAQTVAFYQELLERVVALPGVESAAATTALPMSGWYSGLGFEIEGRPAPEEWRQQMAQSCAVTPGYFQTMGIALLRGRDLSAADRESASQIIVISDTMAQRYWPDADPVGQRVRYRGGDWLTIAGVAADTRYSGPSREPNSTIYQPHSQAASARMFLAVRLRPGSDTVVAAIREFLTEMDADVPLTRVALMDELLADTLIVERLVTVLLGAFALLALVLAAVGLYGVVAHSVARQTREIGLRVALGATPPQVFGGVLWKGLLLALGGAAWGMLAAAAAARALSSVMYGIEPADPVIFTFVPLMLCAVALLASYVPARRATCVDPAESLRAE